MPHRLGTKEGPVHEVSVRGLINPASPARLLHYDDRRDDGAIGLSATYLFDGTLCEAVARGEAMGAELRATLYVLVSGEMLSLANARSIMGNDT